MATLSLKPTQRFAPSDWFQSNDLISTNAERSRFASHDIRQEGRMLANGKEFENNCTAYVFEFTELLGFDLFYFWTTYRYRPCCIR